MTKTMDDERATRERLVYKRAFRYWESFNEPEGLGTQLLYLVAVILADSYVDLWENSSDDETTLLRWLRSDAWKDDPWITKYYRVRRANE